MPNSGKSNWVDSLLVNLARSHGWNFAIFSPENQPLQDHMSRMIEKSVGLPFAEGPAPRMTRAQLDQGQEFVDEHFTWILPDEDVEWTVDAILDRAKQLVLRKGITGLVIDPWNELEHEFKNRETETLYISKALKRVRQWGRRHGCHVFVVAHPSKLYRDKKTGEYPVPTLYDISGSAHWRNKCDNGIVVWRDFSDGTKAVEIHVQNIRFRQIGKLGMAKLKYEPPTATYREFGFHEYGRGR
jgi:twinkle protein